ncbi:MAG: pyrroloquinoline quinone biosynthesis protein PqqE [Microgenomates group bacterium ADurb.Bin238]|nr:MAG: pyrroloquinoline quinone biosynthesis protein PqqE [Microgenomates group bacterium ADurb.Bin238]
MSVDEYARVFEKLGGVYWFTFSGGEPFLRDDIAEICRVAYENCQPGIINIPTNGLLYDVIPEKVSEILRVCPKSQVVVNVSLDGVGSQHDQIRGIPGNYEKTLKTFASLRSLRADNFELGIHSVVSKFNVLALPEIHESLRLLKPDSYITEIAEERVELGTIGSGVTPSLDDYSYAIDNLSEFVKRNEWKGTSKLTQSFRLEYYKLVKQALKEKRQPIPCFAGVASAQISPDGDVWTCCIRADPIGNLRAVDYDFRKVWFSDRAEELRASIKAGECWCPLANASYTNMLCNFKTLVKVGWRWIT